MESHKSAGNREPLELTVILDYFCKFMDLCCIGENIILICVGGTLPDAKLGRIAAFSTAEILLLSCPFIQDAKFANVNMSVVKNHFD